MVIMGVDPGSRVTGYGIILMQANRFSCLEYGVVSAGADAPPQRLAKIHAELRQLIARRVPDVIAVEEVFYSANVRSALMLGQARGIVLLAAAESDVRLAEYSALEIKKAVVGYGRADKRQVQQMVCRLLNLKHCPEPFDASDALAIALCHAFNGARSLHTRLPGSGLR
jgi:crossover junction endodeoxyribonuclease RuvC